MFETDNDITIKVTPKNADSRWVALDDNNQIIAEGKTPDEVIKLAIAKGVEFTLLFVPLEDNTYFF